MDDATPAADRSLRSRHLAGRHGAANIAWLLAMHGALGAWLWWGAALVPVALFVPLAVLACLVHQRQLSEWYHEATHWNLVPDRAWNDRLADLLMGTLNGVPVRANRPGHFRHHAVTAFFTADDPDTRGAIATTRRELARGLLRDLTGRTALGAFASAAAGGPAARAAAAPGPAWFGALALLHGAGLWYCVAHGRWYAYPLWFGTLLTLYPVANRLRLYAQHAHLAPDGAARLAGSPDSRTFHASLAEQLLLHSPVIMYHHEHHARPALPYRALRALSRPAPDPDAFGTGGLRFVGAVLRGLPP
jgi:fatty acid desaturase